MNFTHKIYVAALALLIISGGVSAQQVKKKSASTAKPATAAAQTHLNYLQFDPNVLIGKLPNGITSISVKTANRKTGRYLYLVNQSWFCIGNRRFTSNEPRPLYREHMAF